MRFGGCNRITPQYVINLLWFSKLEWSEKKHVANSLSNMEKVTSDTRVHTRPKLYRYFYSVEIYVNLSLNLQIRSIFIKISSFKFTEFRLRPQQLHFDPNESQTAWNHISHQGPTNFTLILCLMSLFNSHVNAIISRS